MEPLQDWQSSQFEEELSRLDRGGVAFEFLRRNGRYRQDYAEALERIVTDATTESEALRRLSRRWGLAFRGGPRCIGINRASRLASPRLPCHACCHGCPTRLCSFFAS